jgi:hypothetical protein
MIIFAQIYPNPQIPIAASLTRAATFSRAAAFSSYETSAFEHFSQEFAVSGAK